MSRYNLIRGMNPEGPFYELEEPPEIPPQKENTEPPPLPTGPGPAITGTGPPPDDYHIMAYTDVEEMISTPNRMSCADPQNPQDVTTKRYVDDRLFDLKRNLETTKYIREKNFWLFLTTALIIALMIVKIVLA